MLAATFLSGADVVNILGSRFLSPFSIASSENAPCRWYGLHIEPVTVPTSLSMALWHGFMHVVLDDRHSQIARGMASEIYNLQVPVLQGVFEADVLSPEAVTAQSNDLLFLATHYDVLFTESLLTNQIHKSDTKFPAL